MSKTKPEKLPSFIAGQWISPTKGKSIHDAIYGQPIYLISSEGVDFKAMLSYGRTVGGPNLRALSFHERAHRLKALAQHLMAEKELFYSLSSKTGATRKDAWIDVEGGIGTLFSYSSIVRKELPDERFWAEDSYTPLSRDTSFGSRHILSSKEGIALHINAFNFPCWGMLEKLAPTFLAGVPAIIKPASQTAYVTQAMVKTILDSELLPQGALQLICGHVGDSFDHLTEQDCVTFTGSAETGIFLKRHPNIIEKAIPFNMESDSLNCAILGKSVEPDSPEFELFVKEVASEMSIKTGQRCTAIRRAIVPQHLTEAVSKALIKKLQTFVLGDPTNEQVTMGPLVGKAQKEEVAERVKDLQRSCELIYGGEVNLQGGNEDAGGFFPASLLYCEKPFSASEPHDIEAFGPVTTLLPYDSLEDAIALSKLGRGSLVGSIVSHHYQEIKTLALGTAAYHGRLHILNRDNAKASTGHGSPLPQLLHGGPGRAGGGEELGGTNAIRFYMQRTALQADPTSLMHIVNEYVPGAKPFTDKVHPFRKYFEDLQIGETYITHRRTITEADIVNFANISGDYFYAHMDEPAAKESLFGKRVAHGYFLVSAAAGLFVDPAPGPVLANYGLENLRFIEPVGIGDTLQASITVKQKIKKAKRDPQDPLSGVVSWDVTLNNQDDETVALYSILTLVARREV